MNGTEKGRARRAVIFLAAGLLFFGGCKDLFHPEGPKKTEEEELGVTVTFDADGGSPAIQTRTANSGGSIGYANMPSEPSKSGYTFDGWYSGDGGAQFTGSTTVTADITVYAYWMTNIAIPATSLEAALTWLDANAVGGVAYTITLNANETIGPTTLSYSGKNLSITIKGDTTERTVNLSAAGSLFTVGSGVTLTLDNNVTLQGRNGMASLVWVNSGGTLVMNTGSKISGNSSSNDGGGVYVGNNSTFTMNGGTISGNSSSSYGGGGGVLVGNGGTFTMNGGAVSGNSSSYGGGGGGVLVGNGGTFTMSGGSVSGNSSSSYGGGVYVNGTFTMDGGEISGNSASRYGGGVYLGNGTFIKWPGAVIYGSDASGTLKNTVTNSNGDSSGHAVFVNSSPAKIRNTTAGTGVTLNSGTSGSAGGWE